MQRVELTKPTMQGWSRLDAEQRDKFFEAFVSAALRLDRLQLREWLRKRLKSHPLVAVDLAAFAISDREMALLLKTLPLRPNDADRGTGRDCKPIAIARLSGKDGKRPEAQP